MTPTPSGLVATISIAWVVLTPAAARQDEQVPEQLRTDSRSPYVHRITLYDHDGAAIDPSDPMAPPYSPIATCGKCHPVGQIGHGWHFNAGEPGVDAGRRGEPWIYTDPATGTAIPISARRWPGAFTPRQVGLTNWDFIQRFGSHLPGGGLADPPQPEMDDPPESLRWAISGGMQIDCMICHSADQSHDPAEAERQIERQNLKWIPTAALGVGAVRGEAKNLPDDFDPLAPPSPDYPDRVPPQVQYDESRFDVDDRVFFNVTRRVPVERCYFCHSFREAGPAAEPAWHSDGDVHMRAGLLCVDCHRNGLDHMIVRGYRGEPATRAAALGSSRDDHGATTAARSDLVPELQAVAKVETLTCRGCHLGTQPLMSGRDAAAGRLGAPYPEHRGIPLLHFEKLTCTACHSGPWPQDAVQRFQTAMNHGLGVPTRERTQNDPPAIVEPVFARNEQGAIAPHRMIWPAYWAVLESGNLTPLPLDQVQRASAKLSKRAKPKHGAAGPLTDEEIIVMLTQLAAARKADSSGTVVYVRDGRVHRLDPGEPGKLTTIDNPDAAQPYLWPVAHDVRPASQSLGVRGCADCHAADAPIYFGKLAAAGEASAAGRPVQVMHELRDEQMPVVRNWAALFAGRDAFKLLGLLCSAVLFIVLVRHGLAGLGGKAAK